MPDRKEAALDILVVDDEAAIRRVLQICLEGKGHRVTCASTAGEAMTAAATKTHDIALLDVRLGNDSGLDLIIPMRRRFPWMRIIVITAHASVESAVAAMRDGASDYLPKPFTPEQVLHTVDRVRRLAELETRVDELEPIQAMREPISGEELLETRNPKMQGVVELAQNVAATDASVLVRGESGTGKTALARRIHEMSHRAKFPFVVVSCPSLSRELLESELFGHVKGAFTGAHRDYPGRIAAAQRGTLFLDEIGEMAPSLQAKMLRFLQEREYESVGDTTTKRADVRILAATNVDLEKAVAEGRFREDLLFRLNVIEVEMVPLRERPEDIIAIANRLLVEHAATYRRPAKRLSESACDALLAYTWPGNIRELRNVLERSVLLASGEVVGEEHFPSKLVRGSTPAPGDPLTPTAAAAAAAFAARGRGASAVPSLDAVEEAHIRYVLSVSTSLEEAARTLGIDQTTLYRRRKRYGMD